MPVLGYTDSQSFLTRPLSSFRHTYLIHQHKDVINEFDKKYVGSHLFSKKKDRSFYLDSYYVAMSAYHLHNYDKAVEYFNFVLDNINLIQLKESEDWILYHLAKSHFALGNKNQGLAYFKQLRHLNPEFIFLRSVLEKEAKIYFDRANTSDLIKSFSQFSRRIQFYNGLTKSKKQHLQSYLFYTLALANKLENRKYNAVTYFKRVILLRKNDKDVKSAFKHLLNWKQVLIRSFSLQEKMQWLQFNRTHPFFISKSLAKSVSNLWIYNLIKSQANNLRYLSAELKWEYYLQCAFFYEQNNKPIQVRQFYKKAMTIYPKSTSLYQQAHYHLMLWKFRSNKQRKFKYFVRLLDNPYHPKMDKICVWISKNYTVSRLPQSILFNWIKASVSLNKTKGVDKLLFDWFQRRQYSSIIRVFNPIVNLEDITDKYRVKILYWLAKSSLMLGQNKQAISYFKTLYYADPDGYYAYLAESKFKLLEPSTFKIVESSVRNKRNRFFNSSLYKTKQKMFTQNRLYQLKNNSEFNKAGVMLYLGEVKYGYRLFRQWIYSLGSNRYNYYFTSILLFQEMKLNQFVIRYSEMLALYISKHHAYFIPFLKRKIYPLPFRNLVFNMANKYKIDPLLVMSVIRAESKFFPGATSTSAAIGLMQLLPSTAVSLKKLSVKKFYRESINIRFGVEYLNWLFSKSKSLILSVAGYNGGPTFIRRIHRRFIKNSIKNDLEHFTEIIPVNETRGYVKKVLTNYARYSQIYKTTWHTIEIGN